MLTKIKIIQIVIFFAFLILATSCSHSIHQVALSETWAKLDAPGKNIDSSSEQFVVLGFAFDVNYVDDAQKALAEKCKNGKIDRIQSIYSTDHGFFSWTNKIRLTARCLI